MATPARAHDLVIDRLILFPEPQAGVLRGQIAFDPELTRKRGELPGADTERQVLALLRASLKVEADGRALRLQFELRELWTPGGATPGDSVTLEAQLPQSAREIRVFIAEPFRGLAVTVQASEPGGGVSTRTTLVRSGAWSPPYRLAAAPDGSWSEGGPDELELSRMLPPKMRHSGEAEPGAPKQSSAVGFEPQSTWEAAGTALRLGFLHVIPHGWDHVLFVAGLVLGSCRRLRSLLLQIAAFTLAHTITLALGALGLVSIPGAVVEPLIAASIAFIGVENLRASPASQYRVAVVFAFGLLHGLGFAAVLFESGLTHGALVVSLLSFNVGVELGQLAVVALVLIALAGFRQPAALYRYAVRPGSLGIAAAGLFWTVQRLAT